MCGIREEECLDVQPRRRYGFLIQWRRHTGITVQIKDARGIPAFRTGIPKLSPADQITWLLSGLRFKSRSLEEGFSKWKVKSVWSEFHIKRVTRGYDQNHLKLLVYYCLHFKTSPQNIVYQLNYKYKQCCVHFLYSTLRYCNALLSKLKRESTFLLIKINKPRSNGNNRYHIL